MAKTILVVDDELLKLPCSWVSAAPCFGSRHCRALADRVLAYVNSVYNAVTDFVDTGA